MLKELLSDFRLLFRHRGFVHWHVGEGFSESGFTYEEKYAIKTLIEEYKEVETKESWTVEGDG